MTKGLIGLIVVLSMMAGVGTVHIGLMLGYVGTIAVYPEQ